MLTLLRLAATWLAMVSNSFCPLDVILRPLPNTQQHHQQEEEKN
jgi:hypothetical protein